MAQLNQVTDNAMIAIIQDSIFSKPLRKRTIKDKYREYKQKHKDCFTKQHYDYEDIAQYDFHQFRLLHAHHISNSDSLVFTTNSSIVMT